MSEKNEEMVQKQVFYTGFSEIHKDEVTEALKSEKNVAVLFHKQKINDDDVKATLYFRKSDKGNWFFNSYDLAIAGKNGAEDMKQSFRIRYGNTYSLKESYNMMQGRSVNKTFLPAVVTDNTKTKEEKEQAKPYLAWAYMDFKETDKHGNYLIKKVFNHDLEKVLSQYPIKELDNASIRSSIIDSLKKGNIQAVTFVIGDKEERKYIQAAPRTPSLKVYNDKMVPERLSTKIKQDQGQEQTTGVKQEQGKQQKQDATTDMASDDGEPAKKNRQRRKQGVS
ncbi:MAG TPA: hypothetical protein VN040_14190 [Pseudosphingobacterium sp.]|nr:hypothetical protein [Pseudosphingobacterium sp.]